MALGTSWSTRTVPEAAPDESPERRPASDDGDMPRARWLRTTPGSLRLLSILALIGLVLLAVVGTAALVARRNAARSVGLESGPQVTMANRLFACLADADATASGALLRNGLEPPSVRQRYLDDLTCADRLVVALADEPDLSRATRHALQTVSAGLPLYSGRVEVARLNSRIGNPVGAAYMREASATMRAELLPAAITIFEDAAGQLQHDYDAGTSGADMTWLLVIGLLVASALVVTLVFAARRTNRIVNVGVAGALAIVAVLVMWSALQLNGQQETLARAQREGSDTLELLSGGRTIALQAQAAANIALAERGTGESYVKQFDDLTALLGGKDGRHGLLGHASRAAARAGAAEQVDRISAAFADYREAHSKIRALDDGGDYDGAVAFALSDQADGLAGAADELDARFTAAIGTAEARFTDAAADARGGFGVLVFTLAVGMAAAAAFVLTGLKPRIEEYR